MCAGSEEVTGNTRRKKRWLAEFTGSFENHAKKLGHNFCMQKEVTKGFWQGIILSALAAS